MTASSHVGKGLKYEMHTLHLQGKSYIGASDSFRIYNHNRSNLLQCLCITLVITKLVGFEINTLNEF